MRTIKEQCYEKCGFKKRGILRLNNRQAHAGNLILMEIACEAIRKQKFDRHFF